MSGLYHEYTPHLTHLQTHYEAIEFTWKPTSRHQTMSIYVWVKHFLFQCHIIRYHCVVHYAFGFLSHWATANNNVSVQQFGQAFIFKHCITSVSFACSQWMKVKCCCICSLHISNIIYELPRITVALTELTWRFKAKIIITTFGSWFLVDLMPWFVVMRWITRCFDFWYRRRISHFALIHRDMWWTCSRDIVMHRRALSDFDAFHHCDA